MKAKSKRSQATLIRDLLAKKLPAEQIVARVKKSCGGKPSVGYVNKDVNECAEFFERAGSNFFNPFD